MVDVSHNGNNWWAGRQRRRVLWWRPWFQVYLVACIEDRIETILRSDQRSSFASHDTVVKYILESKLSEVAKELLRFDAKCLCEIKYGYVLRQRDRLRGLSLLGSPLLLLAPFGRLLSRSILFIVESRVMVIVSIFIVVSGSVVQPSLRSVFKSFDISAPAASLHVPVRLPLPTRRTWPLLLSSTF